MRLRLGTRFKQLSRGGRAEERKWFQAGMFDQLKQWLENSGEDSKRLGSILTSSFC